MSNESNKENEMTNTADENDSAETAAIPACDVGNDVTDGAAVPAKDSDSDMIEASAMQRQDDVVDAADVAAGKVENAGDQTTEALPVVEPSDTTGNESADEAETIGEIAGAPFDDTSDSTDSIRSAKTENENVLEIPADAEDEDPAHADNAGDDAAAARETGDETETAAEPGAGAEAGTGGAPSAMPNQTGYASPSNFAGASASSGTYVRVPRDMPQQMPQPQPPTGPSKPTVFLSLLPLFLGALMLFVGSAFPMIFAPISGGIDVRSLIAMAIVVLGALLIVLAALLALASLISKRMARRRAGRKQ